MDYRAKQRTQKVLDNVEEVSKAQEKVLVTGEPLSREELLRLLEQLHQSLEQMFWADDFKRKEGNE
jgi:arsenate reductase-like glutaredoxin family protein